MIRPSTATRRDEWVWRFTVGLENGINQPWDDPELPLRQISPDFDELITVVDALRDEFGRDAVGT